MKLVVTLEIEISEMSKKDQQELKRYCPVMEDDLFDPSTYTAQDLASCIMLHEECMSGTDVFVDFGKAKVLEAHIADG